MEEVELKILEYTKHHVDQKTTSVTSSERDCPCEMCLSLQLSSLEISAIPSSIYNKCHTLQKLYLDYNDLLAVPPEMFTELPMMKVLSVIGNDLQALPESIGEARFLEELYCNENCLRKLPACFSQLHQLRVLNVIGNQLKQLPRDIETLQKLERLYAGENCLAELPDAFGLLTSMLVLELECNELKDLPRSFGRFQALKILNLSSNKLANLSENFSDLNSLETLDLSSNSLKSLPETMSCCDTLRKLYVETNTLSDLPDWIGQLPALEEFSCRSNHLQKQALPDSFGHTSKKLRVLDMAGNFMSSVPDSIGELQNLEVVHFGSVIDELDRANFQNGNWMWSIPSTFSRLTKLRSVNLEENQIEQLPDEFGRLVNLEFLDLGQNRIHELPLSFGELRSLKVCQLSKNHLELLPPNFGNLSKLEEFRVDHNKLGELPESFSGLSNLKTLDLFNNCLHEFPICLYELKNLIRLDLDRNNLKVHYLDVPQMIVQSKYAPRDPGQKDNWRGRPRQDLVEVEPTKLEISDGNEDNVEECDSAECQEPEYNSTALRNAMQRNMSIWRSHKGSGTRDVDRNYGNQMYGMIREETRSVDDGNWSDVPDTCTDDTGVSGCLNNLSTSPDSGSPFLQQPFECTENWDDEVDNSVPVDLSNPYGTKEPVEREELYEPGTTEYCYVGTEHMFLPSALHAASVQRFDHTGSSLLSHSAQFDNPDGSAVHNRRRCLGQATAQGTRGAAEVEAGQFDDVHSGSEDDGEMAESGSGNCGVTDGKVKFTSSVQDCPVGHECVGSS